MSVPSLRAELSDVLPPSRLPDDDTLEALLAVTGGNVSAARSMALDSVGAEQRLSGQTTPAGSHARRRRVAEHAYPPPFRARQAGYSASTATGPGTPGGPVGLMAVVSKPWQLLQALLLFLSRWLPLRALLPSFFFPPPSRSGWLMGTADPTLAAARYRERLQSFCDHGNFVNLESTGPAEPATSSTSAIEMSSQPGFTQRHSEATQSGDESQPGNVNLRVPTTLLSIPYEQAISRAKNEHRILVVALESGDNNQEMATYLSQTLLKPEWNQLLERNDILLWAGDVSAGQEAAQVSRILRATTYPYVAFVASQPRPSGTGSSRVRLAVISRHQGAEAVTLPLLTTQVDQVVVPRVNGFLTSLRDEDRAKEMERQWRVEQEEAYAQAAQRDAERITAKREEVRKVEQKQQEEEAKRQAAVWSKARYVAWRRWASRAVELGSHLSDGILIAGTDQAAPGTKTEFVIRLPTGGRTSIHLAPEAKVEALFVAIEMASPLPDDDMGELPVFDVDELALFRPEYKFKLVTDYPRRIVQPTADVLSQPLSASGLLGQGPVQPPRKAVLILDGPFGWESEESEESESEDK